MCFIRFIHILTQCALNVMSKVLPLAALNYTSVTTLKYHSSYTKPSVWAVGLICTSKWRNSPTYSNYVCEDDMYNETTNAQLLSVPIMHLKTCLYYHITTLWTCDLIIIISTLCISSCKEEFHSTNDPSFPFVMTNNFHLQVKGTKVLEGGRNVPFTPSQYIDWTLSM